MDADYPPERNTVPGQLFPHIWPNWMWCIRARWRRRCGRKKWSWYVVKKTLCVKVRRNVGNWRQCAAGTLETNSPPRSFPLNAKYANEAPGTQMSRRGRRNSSEKTQKHCKKKKKLKNGTSSKIFRFFSHIHPGWKSLEPFSVFLKGGSTDWLLVDGTTLAAAAPRLAATHHCVS